MKKSIFTLLVFMKVSLCAGQVMMGYTNFIGLPIGLQPHEVEDKPFLGRYFMFGYRKNKYILESEFYYLLILETEYNNKKDKTAFAWYGIGIQMPLITPYSTQGAFRTGFGVSLVFREIFDDLYVDALSLNLQSGYRLGLALKILLEFNESDLIYPCLGIIAQHDFWAFGVKDRTNVKLWRYAGLYFAVRVNMSEMFKGILN